MHRSSLYAVLGIVIGALLIVVSVSAQTPATVSVSGWGWGGSTSGTSNNPNFATGIGWIKLGGAAGGQAYSMTIPTADNSPVTGYIWSSNVGWIHFAPQGDTVRYPGCGFPAAPCHPALREGTAITGWARIVGIKDALAAVVPAGAYGAGAPNNAGGYEGWVKLSGTSADNHPYGVSINGTQISGYAWSNDLGWILVLGVGSSPITPPGSGPTNPPGSSGLPGQINPTPGTPGGPVCPPFPTCPIAPGCPLPPGCPAVIEDIP